MAEVQPLCERVLGFGTNDAPKDAVLKSFATLTGQELEADAMQTELARLEAAGRLKDIVPMNPDDLARKAAIDGLFQLLRDDPRDANVLVDWPLYHQAVRDRGRRIGGRALLVGAASPLTSRSFEVLAEDTLGANEAVVIDIVAAKDTARHGNFIQADGLHMPLPDQSVQHVVTNRLLHGMADVHNPDVSRAAVSHRFLQEAHRVLTPGGQLLMVEYGPSEEMAEEYDLLHWPDLTGDINAGLRSTGFVESAVTSVDVPVDARHVFATTPGRFVDTPGISDAGTYVVLAFKAHSAA